MLSYINENLCKLNKGSFVTAIYAVYDAPSENTQNGPGRQSAAHPLQTLREIGD